MAQYKSFASKGSFSDFQMTAPDQSDKIARETERQLRGMERAQRFTEKNREILGQAMREAQATNEQIREQNFKSETEYRRAYRDAQERNYRTELENDANAAKAQQQAFKDLSEFSQTAFNLYGQIDKTLKKAELSVKHKLALDAGLDLQDLASLRGIEGKLDRAQFNQLAFIQQKIKEGASSTQISALYEVFKRSGSNQWYEMKGLYQNSVLGHDVALRTHVESLFKDGATPSDAEIKASVEAFNVRYIENNLAGARPEILESSGVYTKIRNNSNTLINSYSIQSAEQRKEQIKIDKYTTLNTKFFENRDVNAIINELQANPSADNRKDILGWAVQSLRSNSITIDEARAILNGKIKVGNNETTVAKQYNGFIEVTELHEAIESRRKQNNVNFIEQEALRKAEVNAQSFDTLNEKVVAQGFVTKEDLETERDYLLQNGGDVTSIDKFLNYEADTIASRAVDSDWQNRYEKTGLLPTIDEINNFTKLDAGVRSKWLKIIKDRNQIAPQIKEHEKAIRDQVKAAPQIQALGSASASGTVSIMQTRMIQEYKRLLRTTDPDAALALIIDKIQKIQADPAAFDSKGNYTSIMNELASDRARGEVDAAALNAAIDVIKTTPTTRKDFKELASAMGASVVYSDLDNLMSGRPTSALFNNVANKLNMSPYELAQTLDKAGRHDVIKGPLVAQWDKIIRQSAESNKGKRLRNTNREVVERTYRANTMRDGSGATAPVRSSFGGSISKNEAAFIQTVRSAEGTFGANGYNTVYGGAVVPQLTQFTLGELYDAIKLGGTDAIPERLGGGKIPFKKDQYNSSASGALQLMPETLRGLVERGGYSWDTVFSPETQDRMIIDLARQGGVDFGNMNADQIRKAGRIWAGLTRHYGQTNTTAEQSFAQYNRFLNQ